MTKVNVIEGADLYVDMYLKYINITDCGRCIRFFFQNEINSYSCTLEYHHDTSVPSIREFYVRVLKAYSSFADNTLIDEYTIGNICQRVLMMN